MAVFTGGRSSEVVDEDFVKVVFAFNEYPPKYFSIERFAHGMANITHGADFGVRDLRPRRGDTKTATTHDWREMANDFHDAPTGKQTLPTNGHSAYLNVSRVGHKRPL